MIIQEPIKTIEEGIDIMKFMRIDMNDIPHIIFKNTPYGMSVSIIEKFLKCPEA